MERAAVRSLTFSFSLRKRRDFRSIRRRDINELLDSIAKDSAWNADHVLSIIRKISNWHATRDDDYVSPFVKGMRRTRSEGRERDRILDDDELRKVWKQAEANGTFGALVRVLLLTAQRRSAVVGMKWSDITADCVWEIDTERANEGHSRCGAIAEGSAGDHQRAAPVPEQSVCLCRRSR
jgi:integrase